MPTLRPWFFSRAALAAVTLLVVGSSRPNPVTATVPGRASAIPVRVPGEVVGEVIPDGQVLPYGTTTANLEVFWCSDADDAYLTGGATFTFNGEDVSNAFSLTANGNQSLGCEMWWRYEGTVTVPEIPGDYGLDAQANGWPSSPYASGSVTRPYRWQQVKVTADPRYATVAAGSSGNTQTFVVWNLGAVEADYTLSSSCTGSGVSSCSLSSSTLSGIAAGDSAAVTVTYTAGSNGTTGVIQLIATDGSQAAPADTVKADISAQSAPSAGVTVARSVGTQRRGACVTLALASDAAMECGDLRITHALPTTVTVGSARTPTLVYNSSVARPIPIVQADVTTPCSLPTTIHARVYISGNAKGYRTFSGSDWGSCGTTRRVSIDVDASAFATSLQTYFVEIIGSGGAGGYYTSSNETLAVVDRSGSAFGAGWWLAGLERLVVVDGSTMLWIGGDGSSAVYSGGSGTYIAAAFDRPDTITYNGGTGEYTRQGPGNVDVKFNSSGYHISTTNRQGFVTRFTYVSGTDRLDSLIVPVRSGTPLAYRFVYTNNLLDSIIAPAAGTARNVKINRSGAVVTSIRDADGSTVSFGYLGGGNANIINSRTDRRSNTTYFTYNSANHVIRDSLYLGSSQFIRQILRPAESASLSTALSLDASYTSIDGPRTDVADITKIWVNQFGQPTKVRDAEGAETEMQYDGTWPGLVSQARSAAGHVTRAAYNSSTGLLESVRSISPYGTSDSAVTTYLWNTAWRAPIRVTGPTGVVDTMDYDGSGNRTFAQTGRNSARRVNFTYTSDNLDSAVTLPSGVGSPVTKLVRNALGNVSSVINPKGYVSFTYQNAIGQDTLIATPFSDTTNAASFSASYYTTVSKKYSLAGQDSVTVSTGPNVSLPSPYSDVDTTRSLTVLQKYDAEGNPVATRRQFYHMPYGGYSGSTITLVDSSIYDAANRLTTSMTPNTGKGFTLDGAGNVTAINYARGYTVSMVYDRANRMVRKIIPQVTEYATHCTSTGINWPSPPYGCSYYLPTVGGDACIDADTLRFGYNGVGRLQAAHNKYARVTRAYNPNGSVKTETQRIRSYHEMASTPCRTAPAQILYGGTEFSPFTLSHTYDLAGNRTGLEVPVTTGCSGTCTITWAFSDTTGLLASVTDESAGTSYFGYDLANRLTTISTPGSWTDSRSLDALGNTYSRTVSGSSTAVDDDIAYDAAGRIKKASIGYRSGSSWGQDAETWYNPHGAVLAASGATNATGGSATERFFVDAIGNRRYTRANNLRPQAHADVDAIRDITVNAGGQMTASDRSTGSFLFHQTINYDYDGNVSLTHRTELDYLYSTNLWVAEKSWYAADGKLALFNKAVGPLANDETHPGEHTVFEEYRYDAFGRRVGVRRRLTGGCSTASNSDCASAWTRTVWDGDQVLVELRTLANDTASVFTMEAGTPTSSGTNTFSFGRVRYVHAGGIDQPVAVVRHGLTGSGTSDPYVVFPHANWRGQYESGHKSDGTFCYSGSSCIAIAWPGARTSIDGEDRNPSAGHAWFGSLITGNTDGSGKSYLRNRYYDPQTGRFTQEDPIGLAGGVNAYGFAGGDRINFSDPMGLKQCPPDCNSDGMGWAREVGRILKPAQRPLEIAGMVATAPLTISGEGAMLTLGLAGRTTFFRGVSAAEAADFAAVGRLRGGAAAAGNEGKYLTNSMEAAAMWGEAHGAGSQVLRITVPAEATRAMTALGRIDGIGQAWWAPMDALKNASVSVAKTAATAGRP